jgi:hypothetical protein
VAVVSGDGAIHDGAKTWFPPLVRYFSPSCCGTRSGSYPLERPKCS